MKKKVSKYKKPKKCPLSEESWQKIWKKGGCQGLCDYCEIHDDDDYIPEADYEYEYQ